MVYEDFIAGVDKAIQAHKNIKIAVKGFKIMKKLLPIVYDLSQLDYNEIGLQHLTSLRSLSERVLTDIGIDCHPGEKSPKK